jgi:hypothetical protein
MPYIDREKRREAERKSRLKKPEKHRAAKQQWLLKNRDRVREQHRLWYHTRKAKLKAFEDLFAAENIPASDF